MKKRLKYLVLIGLAYTSLFNFTGCSEDNDDNSNNDNGTNTNEDVVIDVDASLFLVSDSNDYVTISTVPCTLSDGTETECYQIITKHTPSDHEMGPWCPETINDEADAGGLWIDNGVVYDVDGAFIENLAEFYGDANWKMYDDDGNVIRMETQEQCLQGADANIEDEFLYMCAQCLPEWIEVEKTYLIPITPVKQDSPKELSGGVTEDIRGVDYGPEERGIAFNGVMFAFPAAVDVILAAYQIAPVDDAGGHINNSDGYHYHGDLGHTTQIEQTDGHAPMIGYALDGHGIYSELNTDGIATTDLDECRGHYDETRGYHYHVGNMANNEIFNCYYGAYVVQEDEGRPGGPVN